MERDEYRAILESGRSPDPLDIARWQLARAAVDLTDGEMLLGSVLLTVLRDITTATPADRGQSVSDAIRCIQAIGVKLGPLPEIPIGMSDSERAHGATS